jgi:hypothetical protein
MARKYSVNRVVVEGRDSKSWQKPSDAEGDALGTALFAIDGVASLFATGSFVTVIKTDAAQWDTINPAVEAALTAQLG